MHAMQAFEEVQSWLRVPHHRAFDELWESGEGIVYTTGPQHSIPSMQPEKVKTTAYGGQPLHREHEQWHDSVVEQRQASPAVLNMLCISSASVFGEVMPENPGLSTCKPGAM